ncbi:MAG: glycosyltransferase, partial [Rubrobacteraceae bacterium]
MTLLSPPEKNLQVSVVVPAHNEEELVGACLEALAAQESIAPDEYEVILVLDNCTDNTELRAREVSDVHPRLRLHFLEGTVEGAGHARRVGMDLACKRLLNVGRPSCLIASTDADTIVAPDWLSTQLAHAARGARAIGGRIELTEEKSLPENVALWRHNQGNNRHQDLLAEHGDTNTSVMEHWQFSGASMSLTAAVYMEIGGLEPLSALEDEYLERVLR